MDVAGSLRIALKLVGKWGLGVLAPLLLPVALVTGCASVIHGPLPETSDPPVSAAAHRLRVVVFEMAGIDVPFHSGVVIHAGADHLIYDPAGAWEQRHNGFERHGDAMTDVRPRIEAAYLGRVGIRYSVGGWVTHVFDVDVSPQVARQAAELARETPAVPAFRCALGVSALLAQLPGFETVEPSWITADLLRAMLALPGARYSRYDLRDAQSG